MHLTERQIGNYWARQLPPEELLSVDEHLADCESCRARLLAGTTPLAIANEHLDYEELEAHVDAAESADQRVRVDAHLRMCDLCRAEVADLQRCRDEFRAPRPGPRVPPRSRWLFLAAIAATVVLIASLALLRWPSRTSPPAGTFQALLVDGGESVGIDSAGRLSGLSGVPAEERPMLLAMLQRAEFPHATRPGDLIDNGGVERSAGGEAPEFMVTAPLNRVVLEDRPLLRWTAIEGAKSYRARIFDTSFELVTESEPLDTLEWRPEKPLARDRTYTWQVTAEVGGKTLRAPRPPSSEARFHVLDAARATRLSAALGRSPLSQLELSALYAEAGMNAECLQALARLDRDNPGSPEIARLRASYLARPQSR